MAFLKKPKGLLLLSLLWLFVAIFLAAFFFIPPTIPDSFKKSTSFSTPSPTPTPFPLPEAKTLQNNYHIFQSFNNCGPAALSMALSYYGVHESQETLGKSLRPYQIPGGDNDDKSVTLEELAKKAQEYNLLAYHRPNGNIQLLKQFIAHDMPIVTRTWLKASDDIGHYRVVKGYNSVKQNLIQDDSLQGKNLVYPYEDFNEIWKKFNYEYVVLVPKEKQAIAEAILQEDTNKQKAWGKAALRAQEDLKENPNDVTSRFNLSVALYNTGKYEQSVAEFEKVEDKLSFRTLWYQIEPIQAYYELGNYDRVFQITDKILNNYNRAFSELYIIRGNIYKKQGNIQQARNEFEKAVLYNENLHEAKAALSSL